MSEYKCEHCGMSMYSRPVAVYDPQPTTYRYEYACMEDECEGYGKYIAAEVLEERQNAPHYGCDNCGWIGPEMDLSEGRNGAVLCPACEAADVWALPESTQIRYYRRRSDANRAGKRLCRKMGLKMFYTVKDGPWVIREDGRRYALLVGSEAKREMELMCAGVYDWRKDAIRHIHNWDI